MLVFLPASCFLLIFLHLLGRRKPGADVRPVLLHAAVLCGVGLVAITEILSVLHRLTPGAIAASWAILAGVAALALLLDPRLALPRWTAGRPSAVAVALAIPVAAILLGTGLSAAFGWPNQWDSMVYHLSRVDHWLQNRTVDFYPTHVIRQLYNPPGAEYAILHLRALGGDDRWSNAPQWLAMAGSLVGVSAIARTLGAGPRGQLFATLVAATIPMGILQASGTQNDYVVAFWLVCLTETALSPGSASRTLRIGGALGLALVSKGTAFIFAGPFLLSMPDLFERPWRQVPRGAAILLVALALNAAHWGRNVETFGGPLGPRNPGSAGGPADRLTNEAVSPEILASNIARNLSLHSGTPSRRVNRVLERAVKRGHEWLGLAVDDPRSTRLYSDRRFAIVAEPANPDRAGNPLHLLLVLLAAPGIVLSRRLRRQPGLARYGVALAAAALLFCLALKWQPWHSRLQLPLFVLASPLVGVAFEATRWLMPAAAVLLSLLAARPLLRNRLAPIVGEHTVFDTPRLQQHFQSFRETPGARQQAYVAAAEAVRERRCSGVGLLLGWDDWEHPLWVLLAEPPGRDRRIEHVAVSNDSARLPRRRGGFVPCAVIAGNVPAGDAIELEGRTYRRLEPGERLTVFHLDGETDEAAR